MLEVRGKVWQFGQETRRVCDVMQTVTADTRCATVQVRRLSLLSEIFSLSVNEALPRNDCYQSIEVGQFDLRNRV